MAKKKKDPSFDELKVAAKELTKILDVEIKMAAISYDKLVKEVIAAGQMLDGEDELNELTEPSLTVLDKLGVTSSDAVDDEKPEPVDEKKEKSTILNNLSDVDKSGASKVAKELSKIMNLETPIDTNLGLISLVEEIESVGKMIAIDFKDPKTGEEIPATEKPSDFTKITLDFLDKIGVKPPWKKAKGKESSKVQKMKIHRFAMMIPEMVKDQFDELKSDISANGLKIPILTFQDKIIDGRSRYDACLELGIDLRFEEWEGKEEDLLASIISWNIKRRHLTAAQRAALAAELLPELEKIGKKKQKESGRGKRTEKSYRATEEAAKMTGTNKGAVTVAKKVKKESPKVFKEMKSGEKSIQQAKRETSKKKKEVDPFEVDPFVEMENSLMVKSKNFINLIEDYFDFLDETKLDVVLDYQDDLSKVLSLLKSIIS